MTYGDIHDIIMEDKIVTTTSRFGNSTYYYTKMNETTFEWYAMSQFNKCAPSNSESIKDSDVEVDKLLNLQVFEITPAGWEDITEKYDI